MITEPHLRISFLCGWSMFSSANLSLAAGKMRKNLSPAQQLVTGGFRYYFTEIIGGFL
jgi:hypothetical protein